MNAEQGPEMEDGGRKGEEGGAEAREGGREKETREVSDSAERRNEGYTAQSAAAAKFAP